jgi:hypothetical protein
LVSAGEWFLMSAEIAESEEDRLGFPGIAHFFGALFWPAARQKRDIF